MLDAPTLALAVIIALLALALVALSMSLVFNVRAQRLPAATRYEDIYERLGAAQDTLSAKKMELREVEQKIHERDRYAAEAAHLKEQVEKLRLEQENLAPARVEIEEVKAEAAKAAGEKAEAEKTLADLRAEAEKLGAAVDPVRIAKLREELDDLLRERDRIKSELAGITSELDSATRTVGEARAAEARLAMLEALRDELETENSVMSDKVQIARDAVDTEREARDRLTAEAREAHTRRDADLRDIESCRTEKSALVAEVETLKTLRDELKKGIGGLSAGQVTFTGNLSPEEKMELLKDLVTMPVCLQAPSILRGQPRPETDALHDVDRYLRECGLSFGSRTVRAFHTALKINDTAQLSVLAGVSGTGKSLLPRRYAEAMGIHFLQVAVEPRWDSPQDLLGFYNYVEKKYRATELSRLLVHFDPWQSHVLPENSPDRRDHMAIVLLDEMNLARVEYYFSEFLSRLEARPAWANDLLRERVKDALIPVDIRGLDSPPMLFPAHNILFVGTMNDDESTQSLSDKVLDRGNVLQFPAPAEFPQPRKSQGEPSNAAQRFSEWRGWVRAPLALGGGAETLARDTITNLARIMQDFGKPFGHRLNQSMRAYVTNYPHEGNGAPDAAIPLADQIEFRILPKLRGVEIANHRETFDRLDRLVRGPIADSQLADHIKDNVEDQVSGTGLFVWRGMVRGS